MQMIDLSQQVFSGSPVYRGHQPTVIHRLKSVEQLPNGHWTFAINGLFLSDHAGTHTDSFKHMDPNPEAPAIDELPLDMFHGIGACLDVSSVAPGEFITKSNVEAAASRAGVVFANCRVALLYTGHYGRTFPKPAYGSQHPGLDREAMEWLADQGIVNVGIDCASIDVEPHKDSEWKPAHTVCRERRILNTENLGNLVPVVGKTFYYMGLPLKIADGTAGPIRAVAILMDEGDVETCTYLANLK